MISTAFMLLEHIHNRRRGCSSNEEVLKTGAYIVRIAFIKSLTAGLTASFSTPQFSSLYASIA